MMRLNRARWLRIWAAQEIGYFARGVPELRIWMHKCGYIEGVEDGVRALRVTDAGQAALEQAIADHARHGRPNLGEPTMEQRARREAAEARDREHERKHPWSERWRPSLEQEALSHGPSGSYDVPSAGGTSGTCPSQGRPRRA